VPAPAPAKTQAVCRQGGNIAPVNCPSGQVCQLQGPVPRNPDVARTGICVPAPSELSNSNLHILLLNSSKPAPICEASKGVQVTSILECRKSLRHPPVIVSEMDHELLFRKYQAWPFQSQIKSCLYFASRRTHGCEVCARLKVGSMCTSVFLFSLIRSYLPPA
jgi:hypothetical protein